MRRRPLRPAASGLALALGALLTPAGCSVSQPVPERVRYVLSAEREPAEGPGAAGMLRVGRVRVAPLSERKGFVYRTGERTYETDFFHEFFAPPSTLLRDQVAAWLAAGGAFSSSSQSASPPPSLRTEEKAPPAASQAATWSRSRVLGGAKNSWKKSVS